MAWTWRLPRLPQVNVLDGIHIHDCARSDFGYWWILPMAMVDLFTLLQPRSTWTILLCVHLFVPNVCFVVQQVWRFCSSAWYNPKSFQWLKCVCWISPFLYFSLNIWLTVSKAVSPCSLNLVQIKYDAIWSSSAYASAQLWSLWLWLRYLSLDFGKCGVF